MIKERVREMKKIIILLLALFVMLPVVVSADLGAPSTIIYKATVVKEEGIDCYDFGEEGYFKKGHLDKGAEVYIHGDLDSSHDGKTYSYYSLNQDGYGPDNSGYVLANEVIPVEGDVSPTQKGVSKLTKPVEFIVNANVAYVRRGPAASYESNGELSKGTKSTYEYYVPGSGYIYVDVNGVKGWVNMLGKTVLTKSSGYITVHSINTDCGTIPANTLIEDAWTATAWDGVALLKLSNGCETFYRTFHSTNIYGLSEAKEMKATKEIEVYDNMDDLKVIATIPVDYGLTILARYSGVTSGGGTYYIDYNKTKGWISGYEMMVDGEGIKIEEIEKEEEKEEKENPVATEEQKIAEKENKKKEAKKEETKKQEKTTDTMTIVIMCCVGALAIAAGAGATILLVNKKKKAKVDANSQITETTEPTTAEPAPDAQPVPETPVEQTSTESTPEAPTTEEPPMGPQE
jgi:flagellar basal body-associated protein FliL